MRHNNSKAFYARASGEQQAAAHTRKLSFSRKMIRMGPLVRTEFRIPVEEIAPLSPDIRLPVCNDECDDIHRIQTQMLEARSRQQ